MDNQLSQQELIKFLAKGSETYLAHVSVDCTVFGFDADRLMVLLLKWKDPVRWGLAGGFIEKQEDIDAAAHRVLRERTGLDRVFLRQFHTFGSMKRWQPAENAALFDRLDISIDKNNWMLDYRSPWVYPM